MDPQNVTIPGGQDEIIEFPAGAPIQLPAGLPPLPMNIYSEFGFKLTTISEEGCADVTVWTAATEDDYRAMEARLLNVRPEDVDLTHALGPSGKRCHMFNGVCTGTCAGWYFCRGVYSFPQGLVACRCR
jgi:hypothetical protein